jgi:membrane associated rhomboid family serine protease
MIPVHNAVPSRYPAIVTWTLIICNCVVFLIEIGLTPLELQSFLLRFALIPARYSELLAYGETALTINDLFPFLSMMFLHGGWLHLILNMWTLWLFGPTIEDRLGYGRFIAFYLTCGIVASLAHVIFNPTSTVPALGASGAIAGVLGCYMAVFVGLWFLIQILHGTTELLTSWTGGGVAWWAHVGGFVAGLVLGPLFRRSEQGYRKYYADEGVLGFNQLGYR